MAGWQWFHGASSTAVLPIAYLIWRFHSMAIPGFQELFESRIKNYFVYTARLVRGYKTKNYFIPPQPRRRTFQVLICVQKALPENRRLLHNVYFLLTAPQWCQWAIIYCPTVVIFDSWRDISIAPKHKIAVHDFLIYVIIIFVGTQIIIIFNLQRIQNRKYDRQCVHPEFIFK